MSITALVFALATCNYMAHEAPMGFDYHTAKFCSETQTYLKDELFDGDYAAYTAWVNDAQNLVVYHTLHEDDPAA